MFPCLAYPLIEPDETRYTQIALEMLDSRDWITPTIDGEPYLDKPPLMYWLTAISFSVFGISEFAARAPSVLSAITTIFVVFGIGRRFIGPRGAWIGATALLLSGGFVLAGRFLILDSMLAFFTTLCLLSGYVAVRERRHRWAWWILAGVACALGTLTKGPVALVLCAPPLIVSGWLRCDQTRTKISHWVAFVIPMLVMGVPWYCAVWKFNPEFGDYFFLEHNFNRFLNGSNHDQPFWFYLPILFAVMFPASLLLPTLGVFLLSTNQRKRQLRTKDLGFLFSGTVWILLFFSLSSCKLPTYILPAIPLICLMIGGMLDRTVFEPQKASRITSFLKPFPQRAILILVSACVLIAGVDGWMNESVDAVLILAIVACIAVTLATLYARNRDLAFSWKGWAATALAGLLVLSFTVARFIPTIATTRSLYAKASRIAEQHPEDYVVFYGEKPHGARLQLPFDRVIYFPKRSRDEFVTFVANHRHVIVLTSDEDIFATRYALADTHELVSVSDHEHLYAAQRLARTAQRPKAFTIHAVR
ncbi:phospholipid carrier-dependent glycosyltransferase [Stieleria magnilauensis]